MKLYKKAAVCLVAAVMALSVMTACTPSDAPASSEKPGSGTSQPGGDGGSSQPGEDGGASSKDDSSSTGTASWENSKTYRYNKKFSNAQSIQVDMAVTLLESSNKTTAENIGEEYNVLYASKGNKAYYRTSFKEESERYIQLDNKFYYIDDGEKFCMIQDGQGSMTGLESALVPVITLPQKPICSTITIKGKEYAAETFSVKGRTDGVTFSQKATYCFDQNDDLVYIVMERDTASSSATEHYKYQMEYRSISNVVNESLFVEPKIPDDYDVVDMTSPA